MLNDDQVLRPGEPPAVHNLDRLTEAGMERVVNDHLSSTPVSRMCFMRSAMLMRS
jgi:hypothetical protein